MEDPSEWLEEKGFPIRGIISGRGASIERLAGFVDHFLQPGMTGLPTFLKDTKHTLQVIEELNNKIENEELSLEGVALITLDVDKMYNNITEDLGRGACKKYLETRNSQGGLNVSNLDENSVSTSSILKALDICMKTISSNLMTRFTTKWGEWALE